MFCNVVATSKCEDYELLIKVANVMFQIKEQCTLSMNLYKLFAHLIHLCGHLDDMKFRWQQPDRAWGGTPDGVRLSIPPHLPDTGSGSWDHLEPCPLDATLSGPAVTDQLSMQDGMDLNQVPGLSEPMNATEWDDDLVWELFNMQPSIQSFDLASFDLDLDKPQDSGGVT